MVHVMGCVHNQHWHYDHEPRVGQYEDGVAGVDGWGGGPPGTDDALDFETLAVDAATNPLAHQLVGGGCPEEGGPLGDGAITEVTHMMDAPMLHERSICPIDSETMEERRRGARSATGMRGLKGMKGVSCLSLMVGGILGRLVGTLAGGT